MLTQVQTALSHSDTLTDPHPTGQTLAVSLLNETVMTWFLSYLYCYMTSKYAPPFVLRFHFESLMVCCRHASYKLPCKPQCTNRSVQCAHSAHLPTQREKYRECVHMNQSFEIWLELCSRESCLGISANFSFNLKCAHLHFRVSQLAPAAQCSSSKCLLYPALYISYRKLIRTHSYFLMGQGLTSCNAIMGLPNPSYSSHFLFMVRLLMLRMVMLIMLRISGSR